MPYRVAITSSDGESIDQHFGQAKKFRVIEVQEETGEWQEIESRAVDEVETLEKEESIEEPLGHRSDYLNSIGDLLSDCRYLLTAQIGMRPYKILQQKGINCLESPHNLAIAIEKLNKYYFRNKK